MAKEIEPRLNKLENYLTQRDGVIFRIPEYQRAYSWEKGHCDKLWQDIKAYMNSGGADPYFFGTIIIDCAEDGRQLSLIDGQQRTITFLLLLKALLIRITSILKNIKDTEEYAGIKFALLANRNTIIKILYQIEDQNIPDYLSNPTAYPSGIMENDSINEMHKDELNIIIESVDFAGAEQAVHKTPRKQKDNKYTNHFRNFKYFYENLGDLKETELNEFAKTVLTKCDVIQIKSWQTEQAIGMFNSLNSTGLPLTDADIISAKLYSRAVVADCRDEFASKWEEIKDLTDKLDKEGVVGLDAILTQYMYITRAGDGIKDVNLPGLRRYYTEVNSALLDSPLKLCDNLLNLARVWESAKSLPLIKLALRMNENIKLFLGSYFSRFNLKVDDEDIEDISISLIRLFTILELVDAGYSSKNFKSFLFSINIKLVDPNVDIAEIVADFDSHIESTWSSKDLKEDILGYDKSPLAFLNDYLYATEKNKWFDFDNSVQIEHIMPISGKDISSIMEDAGISSKEEFDGLVNQLGNKILLEASINGPIGNAWFRSKQKNSIKDRKGYVDSSFALAQALAVYPSDVWTKDDIEGMTSKIADRITGFVFAH